MPERLRTQLPALLALALILLVGAWLRLSNLNWDDGHHLHPDERFVTMVGTAIQLPSSVAQYFDTQDSPLNPYNQGHNSFIYGTYPLFLVRALAEPFDAQGYDEIHLLGRAVSALHDLGTIVFVFLIGSHLYGRRVGLLAALLLAFTALHIQQSHFFTVDAYLTFYLTAAFYCALRALETRRAAWYLLGGAVLGLAMASKINALLFGVVLATAVVVDWVRRRSDQEESQPGWSPLAGSLALGIMAAIVFRIAQPYAFAGPGLFDILPNPTWLSDLETWRRFASGEADYPPSHQWAFTNPYLFPLRHMLLWGLGLPLGLAAVGGVTLGALQLVLNWPRQQRHLLLLVWVGINFVYWGGQMAKTMRYSLPIYPFLVILAAYALIWLVGSRLESRGQGEAESRSENTDAPPRLSLSPSALLCLTPLALVTLGTILYGLAFSTIYSRPVTRVAASEWIYETLPPGTAFAWEHWDDPLPLRLPGRDVSVEPCDKVGRNPQALCSFQLTLYDDDTPQKRAKLESILNQVEYIFLSSNRLYGSIPRLPMRYPLTTEYYRLLFSGDLGFRLERTFTSYPSLLGLALNDDSAEEAFTVYDHPKVLIFRKTDDYSPQRVHQLLSRVDLDHVVRVRPTQAPQNGLLLSTEARAAQQASGTWSEIFDRDSPANRAPVLVWLLALELLALAVFPLVWSVLSRLADRGFLLAKLLGLLAASYLAWLAASLQLVPYTRATIAAAILVLAILSALALRRAGPDLVAFVRSRWRLLAFEQGLFLVAFAGFVWIRMANPDLWHPNFGGEKPMDFAYLNAVIKSTFFPPYDPWFAGGYINYYYFGLVLVATLVKLTGIVPWVAYNLAVPLFFALTVGAAFSFGHSFVSGQGLGVRGRSFDVRSSGRSSSQAPDRRPDTEHGTPNTGGKVALLTGLLAALFVAIVGNMDALVQVSDALDRLGGIGFQSRIPGLAGLVNGLTGLRALLAGKNLPPLDFWRSTRVISPEDPGPISEFPYFTFLYGDLHAHMLALPITLAVAVVGLNLLRLARDRDLLPDWALGADSAASPHPPISASRQALLGIACSPWTWSLALTAWLVGMLRATNTWDYPTYVLLAAAAFALAHYRLSRALDLRTVLWTLAALAGLVVLSSLFFQPYLRHYGLFYAGLEPVKQTTRLMQYFIIFGGFLVLVGGVLVVETWRVWRRVTRSLALEPAAAPQPYHAGGPAPLWLETLPYETLPAMGLLMLGAGFSLIGLHTAAFICFALALVVFHALRPRHSIEFRYLLLMVCLGLALTLLPEFVALKGDIGRMNTVFKFYLQAWVLLALAAACAVPYVARRLRSLAGRDSTELRLWHVAVVAVVLAGLIYPYGATRVKLGLRFQDSAPSLDGMAYMTQAVYHDANKQLTLASDFQAITWLLDNVQGSPVIVEAFRPHYRWGARVSIYTGLPTVLGWDWHQKQQRGDFGWMVDQRTQDVQKFYQTTSVDEARHFLERYDVSYVYVGGLERALYPADGLAKFERMVGTTLQPVYRSSEVTIYRVLGYQSSPRGAAPMPLQSPAEV